LFFFAIFFVPLVLWPVSELAVELGGRRRAEGAGRTGKHLFGDTDWKESRTVLSETRHTAHEERLKPL
jgi:hypothetical protein